MGLTMIMWKCKTISKFSSYSISHYQIILQVINTSLVVSEYCLQDDQVLVTKSFTTIADKFVYFLLSSNDGYFTQYSENEYEVAEMCK